jgi:hypothetical protein
VACAPRCIGGRATRVCTDYHHRRESTVTAVCLSCWDCVHVDTVRVWSTMCKIGQFDVIKNFKKLLNFDEYNVTSYCEVAERSRGNLTVWTATRRTDCGFLIYVGIFYTWEGLTKMVDYFSHYQTQHCAQPNYEHSGVVSLHTPHITWHQQAKFLLSDSSRKFIVLRQVAVN